MNWTINIPGISVFLLLAFVYLVLTNGKIQPGAGLFGLGLFIGLLTQVLPLHSGGFPGHMIGHILLLLVVAPLLVLGFPAATRATHAVHPLASFLQKHAWVGWMAGLGVMWFWHLPTVFNAAFSHDLQGRAGVSFLNVSSLIVGGMVFCWPTLTPVKHNRIDPLVGVIYLFTACMGCSLLGLFIAFAPADLYVYAHTVDHAGFTEVLCGNWGLEQANAQQLAGLIMWVPCCFIYLTGALYLLRTWLLDNENEHSSRQPGLHWTEPTA